MMPNCFQLTKKGYPSPAILKVVDAELCQNLDLPFLGHRWTCGWYNDLGLALACGKTLPEMIDIYQVKVVKRVRSSEHDVAMYRIACYLNEHYTTDAWVEIGRH